MICCLSTTRCPQQTAARFPPPPSLRAGQEAVPSFCCTPCRSLRACGPETLHNGDKGRDGGDTVGPYPQKLMRVATRLISVEKRCANLQAIVRSPSKSVALNLHTRRGVTDFGTQVEEKKIVWCWQPTSNNCGVQWGPDSSRSHVSGLNRRSCCRRSLCHPTWQLLAYVSSSCLQSDRQTPRIRSSTSSRYCETLGEEKKKQGPRFM